MLEARLPVNGLNCKNIIYGTLSSQRPIGRSTTLTAEVKRPLIEFHKYQDNSGVTSYQVERPTVACKCPL